MAGTYHRDAIVLTGLWQNSEKDCQGATQALQAIYSIKTANASGYAAGC